MVNITHYEVYTDRGDGWKLEERFPVEQRQNAVKYAREKERENISVKLICEKFDVLDNSYQESTEFVSLAQKKKSKKNVSGSDDFFNGDSSNMKNDGKNTVFESVENSENSFSAVMGALLKLLAVIVFSLFLTHVVVNLSLPLLENIIPEESSKTTLFLFFFGLFLITATPLILKKVPLDAFGFRRSKNTGKIPERRLFKKARGIFYLYNLDERLDPGVVPVYPEAEPEDKRYIIDFLSNVIANLDGSISLRDDFNRFGIKLVIYGGCMELARRRRLNIAQANSLLNEAFGILDGKNYEVADFYDAKRTYKDNRVAVFLVGVGAYLMSQLVRQERIDKNVLRLTFYKWQKQNIIKRPDNFPQKEPKEETPENYKPESSGKTEHVGCRVNILTKILFNEAAPAENSVNKDEIKNAVGNIILNLSGKYNGTQQKTEDYGSISFFNLKNALRFSVEFLRDSETYADELNDDNLIIAHRINILGETDDNPETQENMVQDMFENTYDGEILTDETVYRSVGSSGGWKFDFLGEKTLQRSGKSVPLYKVITM